MKVLEHSAEIGMFDLHREVRAIQRIEPAEAAVDVELQPLDRSLQFHADVAPGEKRIDGTDVPVHFRPVRVEFSIAGDRKQAVGAGFDGHRLKDSDALRLAGLAIGEPQVVELCVLND